MKNWFLWLIVGIISILGGFLALANPLAASITAETLAGWTFVIVGFAQLYAVWAAQGFGAKMWAGITGIAVLFLGFNLLAHPLAGVVALTWVVAVLFLVAGVAKILTSFSLRGTGFFLPVLISGILSVVLAIMILGNFPSSAVSILGVLLAIELISNGIALISLALKRKEDAPAA